MVTSWKRPGAAVLGLVAALGVCLAAGRAGASSHSEAPLISLDPAVDNCDVYFFLDPNRPGMAVMLATFNGLSNPASGPNYKSFAENARYDLKIDNDGDGAHDITYRFLFTNHRRSDETFLYNTGPIASVSDPNLNVYQTFVVQKIVGSPGNPSPSQITVVGGGDASQPFYTVPWNIGPKSYPNNAYHSITDGIYSTTDGGTVACGPRADPFFVDLQTIFDLINLAGPTSRPGIGVGNTGGGKNTLNGFNVMAIMLEVPVSDITKNHDTPTDATNPDAIVGSLVDDEPSRDPSPQRGWNDDRVGQLRAGFAPGSAAHQRGPHRARRQGPLERHRAEGRPRLRRRVLPPFRGRRAAQGALRNRIPRGTPRRHRGGPRDGNPGPEPSPRRGRSRRAASQRRHSSGPHRRRELARRDCRNNAGFPNGRRTCDDVVDIELRVIAGGTVLTPDFDHAPNNELGDEVDAPDSACSTSFPFMITPYQGFADPHARSARPVHSAGALAPAKLLELTGRWISSSLFWFSPPCPRARRRPLPLRRRTRPARRLQARISSAKDSCRRRPDSRRARRLAGALPRHASPMPRKRSQWHRKRSRGPSLSIPATSTRAAWRPRCGSRITSSRGSNATASLSSRNARETSTSSECWPTPAWKRAAIPKPSRRCQRMVDIRPGLPAYSRVSYAREIHGELDRRADGHGHGDRGR